MNGLAAAPLPPAPALLTAVIECGLYKKPIDAIAKDMRYDPLPGEVRAVVVATWQPGRLLPRAAIELMVPSGLS